MLTMAAVHLDQVAFLRFVKLDMWCGVDFSRRRRLGIGAMKDMSTRQGLRMSVVGSVNITPTSLQGEGLTRLIALISAEEEILSVRLRNHALGIFANGGVFSLPESEPGVDNPAHEAAAALVFSDMLNLGGRFEVVDRNIFYTPPQNGDGNAKDVKSRVRASLLHGRTRQLDDPNVRQFLAESRNPPKRRRLKQNVSIDAIVDDGQSLAKELAAIALNEDSAERAKMIKLLIRPVIQLADADTMCPVTGIPTLAIWRYFRHTWSLEYRNTPGRMARFLIRNAARPGMPVMGIACLTNPVMKLPQRDSWIGWTSNAILAALRARSLPWDEFRSDAIRSLEKERSSIRWDDLLDASEINGGLEVEVKLKIIAEAEAGKREVLLRAQAEEHPGKRMLHKRETSPDWLAASNEPLFRKKRADVLASVLMALRVLRTADDLDVALAPGGQGEEAIKTAIHEMSKVAISSKIMDLNVCGAVEPYRELLGGKLVALAMMSKEALEAYATRYNAQASEIASSMAGRPLIKDNTVCVLTTTSLYGSGSSQYNRLRIRIDGTDWRWEEIGRSEGFGTFHLSDDTTATLREIAVRKRGMRNVNSRFGEGSSPLLRQVRDGLADLGIPSNTVLKHASQRIIYAAELYPGAKRDLMLNRHGSPRRPTLEAISDAWIERWVANRIRRTDVIAKISTQGPANLAIDLGFQELESETQINTNQLELF